MLFYLRLLFSADGTAEYGQAIRWLYLYGQLSEKRMNRIDMRNFKKWRKINGLEYRDYLDVARV